MVFYPDRSAVEAFLSRYSTIQEPSRSDNTMKLDLPNSLLYIEPSSAKVKSDKHRKYIDLLKPELDKHTEKHIKEGYGPTVGIFRSDGEFEPNCGTRGIHHCACREAGGNCDYLIFGGKFATNLLAVHYLEYHADEIPASELRKLDSLLKEPEEEGEEEEEDFFDDEKAEIEKKCASLKRTITDLLGEVEKIETSIKEFEGVIKHGKKYKKDK